MTIDLANSKRIALTVRMLSVDAVEKANSGHPGLPLGAADFATVLWGNFLRFNPQDPTWLNRDRFVLSAGHGCMLWYSLLNLFGYDLPISELQRFRQWDSKTPGHPEFGMTSGIETTTGPLGQGFANGVGIALASKMMGQRYGTDLFNNRVFAVVSDGDLMEGISSEAGSLAGHWGLDNLVYLYDDNHISLAAETKVCFTESIPKRFEGLGWFVQQCDGHDMTAVAKCLDAALAQKGKPSMICCRTILGFGSPNKANTHDSHGAPLGKDEVKATKKNLGWPENDEFVVPKDVADACRVAVANNMELYQAWTAKFAAWKTANPQLATQLAAQTERAIPATLQSELLAAFKEGKKDATRNHSSAAIQIIGKHLPNFVGGSADLDPSTKTAIKGSPGVQHENGYTGQNIHFGVREHAMGAIANGFSYQRSWFPYTATFLVFADYMRAPIRLAAISHLQTFFIFTHDSFWVGEDGPTHEPIEHIQTLRAIPNLNVFRPADGVEVAMCYMAALQAKTTPSTLLFTRQNVAALEREASVTPEHVLKGGYVVQGSANLELVLVGTGSEVGVAVDAAKLLATDGIKARVVSIPCLEIFNKQDSAYRDSVIPPSARKVSIEAGLTMGWSDVVGSNGLKIGIDHFGASAPGEQLAEKFEMTAPQVAKKIATWIKTTAQ